MVKTLNLNAEIPPNRELHISLPMDVPTGPAEVVIVISSPTNMKSSTLGDLLRSEFFGMWRDRTDIADSFPFARALRSEAWKRSAK
jgi:hypothetical protein